MKMDIVLQIFESDVWICSDGKTIQAMKLCDGIKHCSNDELPEICNGANFLEFISIPLTIGLFVLGFVMYLTCE